MRVRVHARARVRLCVVWQLLARKPWFPGKNYVDMLKLQVSLSLSLSLSHTHTLSLSLPRAITYAHKSTSARTRTCQRVVVRQLC